MENIIIRGQYLKEYTFLFFCTEIIIISENVKRWWDFSLQLIKVFLD